MKRHRLKHRQREVVKAALRWYKLDRLTESKTNALLAMEHAIYRLDEAQSDEALSRAKEQCR